MTKIDWLILGIICIINFFIGVSLSALYGPASMPLSIVVGGLMGLGGVMISEKLQ